MMKTSAVINVLMLILFAEISAQTARGNLVNEIIPVPYLNNAIFGMPLEQKIAVCLLPSYIHSGKRYPALYFLPGFGSPVHCFTDWGVFQ